MSDWSVHVTIYAWWLVAYLAIGVVLWLPLAYLAYRHTASPKRTFWTSIRDGLHRTPWTPLVIAAAWPLAIYEEIR